MHALIAIKALFCDIKMFNLIGFDCKSILFNSKHPNSDVKNVQSIVLDP